VFSLSNFYNTDGLKRHCQRTCLLQGRDSRRLLHEMFDAAPGGVLVIDQAMVDDPFIAEFSGRSPGVHHITVSGEPTTDGVDACLRRLPGKLDWIVAFGGGSTIDTAKALVAHTLFGQYRRVGYGELRHAGDTVAARALRFVAVPTTAGSGSETSRYYLVSDSSTGEKLVSRTWLVCPEFAVLDSYFLAGAPVAVIVASAFDAFVHLWETLICRLEASPMVDMLSLEGMALILSAVTRAVDAKGGDVGALEDLQRAAAMGGIALSNVRSGLMHTAGEALAAAVPLPHALTLMVFFTAAIESYRGAVRDQERRLLHRLEETTAGRFGSMEEVVAFWRQLFERTGLTSRIREAVVRCKPDSSAVVGKILADVVLVGKENPTPLDRGRIEAFVERAFSQAHG
jgi:alcohol dehydrogenase class IV